MRRKGKKGQSEGQAISVLILVIGLFIVLYILLLPPEERRDIIYVDGGDGVSKAKTILSMSKYDIISPMSLLVLQISYIISGCTSYMFLLLFLFIFFQVIL